jgi:hypothetical protein
MNKIEKYSRERERNIQEIEESKRAEKFKKDSKRAENVKYESKRAENVNNVATSIIPY